MSVLAERMGQLQDNDMKYRYLLMQGQADGNTLERLENKFKWERDERFIRSLTDSVLDFGGTLPQAGGSLGTGKAA